MIANALVPDPAEGRTAERSNVFVIATLYCAAGSTPVRVRNLSPGGALLEGSALPLPGSRVRLCRGSVSASGEVAWSADGRAGVRFDCPISVTQWMPGPGAVNGQQRVDEIVFAAKLNRAPELNAPSAGAALSDDLSFELSVLASGLTNLGDELAEDPHVVASFPEALQMIEAAAQRLNRLANGRQE